MLPVTPASGVPGVSANLSPGGGATEMLPYGDPFKSLSFLYPPKLIFLTNWPVRQYKLALTPGTPEVGIFRLHMGKDYQIPKKIE